MKIIYIYIDCKVKKKKQELQANNIINAKKIYMCPKPQLLYIKR